ncbi:MULTISPECIES: hypothetical protein [unclassified Pseudonocardia]|uniref:hypothetical protein n=1 Tax=unclassified Pseudonocardia TaxID=2619320 RepID=UPI0011AEA2A8|nr:MULTISPECIES: hypothetical protein [unclassified Pseudonocardia]
MDVLTARSELIDLLRDSLGSTVRVYDALDARVDPPGIMVSLPELEWDAAFVEPTSALFQVAYIVKFDNRATESLLAAVSKVSDAIDHPDMVITRASTGSWSSSEGSGLPSYNFTVSVALSY